MVMHGGEARMIGGSARQMRTVARGCARGIKSWILVKSCP